MATPYPKSKYRDEPLVGHRAPTAAQADAGNYAKGHTLVHGMRISIENEAGTTRRGMAEGGRAWSQKMAHDYGYLRGTTGKDKDHIDVFLGPDPHGDHDVHVIDQDNKDGSFDEHKAMLGFPNQTQAVIAYHQNYEPGWDRFRSVTAMPVDKFKDWAYVGNRGGKQKPAADYAAFKGANDVPDRVSRLPGESSQGISDRRAGQDRAGDQRAGNAADVNNAGSAGAGAGRQGGAQGASGGLLAGRGGPAQGLGDLRGLSYAQGGHVVAGRRYLDDGGSAGDAAPSDPGNGDPGAGGVAAGDVGTSAPSSAAPSGPSDAGLSATLADMSANPPPGAVVSDPAISSVLADMQAAPPPSHGSSLTNNVVTHGLGMMANALGIPFGSTAIGLGNAAINGNPSQAASAIASPIGAAIGASLGPVGAVIGGLGASAIGNAIGNMPGVPASSVPADPTGGGALASAFAQADPMGTIRLLPTSQPSSSNRGIVAARSPAMYGAPGNWAMGLQSGWGFARGGSVGPLSRFARRLNG